MDNHPLRAEIIATALANQMVNEMGCNFVTRLARRDGCRTLSDIANAYSTASREIYGFGVMCLRSFVNLDNVIYLQKLQYEVAYTMLRRAMRTSSNALDAT